MTLPAADGGARQPTIERRAEERLPLPVDVEIVAPGGEPELAVLRDISLQGVGIERHSRLGIGQVITCHVLDTPAELPSRYRIEILWQKQHPDGTFYSGGRILTAECRS